VTSFSAFAGEDDPVIDQKLFQSLRERYNGEWMGTIEGVVAGETLKDRSILFEASGQFAEFAFYNIPKAEEDFLYVPPTITSGWVNYYDRTGSSIECGESSYDLKNNPFPAFKCRFTVDSQGNVLSFMDRSAATSNAKPSNYAGWESGMLDFHWRALEEMKGSANAYSENNVRRDSDNRESFHLQIFEDVVVVLYAQLKVKVKVETI
jgi:hypothetical protein